MFVKRIQEQNIFRDFLMQKLHWTRAFYLAADGELKFLTKILVSLTSFGNAFYFICAFKKIIAHIYFKSGDFNE